MFICFWKKIYLCNTYTHETNFVKMELVRFKNYLIFVCSQTPQPQILTSTTFDDDRYSRYTKSRTQILTKPLTNFFEKSSKVPQKLRKRFQDYIKNVCKYVIKENYKKLGTQFKVWQMEQTIFLSVARGKFNVGYTRLTNCSSTFPHTEAKKYVLKQKMRNWVVLNCQNLQFDSIKRQSSLISNLKSKFKCQDRI